MKRILYYIALLLAATFTACQEDKLAGEDAPGEEVSFAFSSASPELSPQALRETVNTLHLLIFDEQGVFVKQVEYADLASVSRVKLAIGKHTFAYISNIKNDLIGGIKKNAKLEDITLSLEEIDKKPVPAGNIFIAKDEVTVGKDKTSDAALKRAVGRMDINVKNIVAGVSLESVTLLGCPKTIHFTGEAVGTSVRLEVPMQKVKNIYKGEVIAFPTSDSIASIEFVIKTDEGSKTFNTPLKNKVEANKIHTINVKSNETGSSFDLVIDTEEVLPWGETQTEDITATIRQEVDSVQFKIFMDIRNDFNLNTIKEVNFDLKRTTSEEYIYFNTQDVKIDFINYTLTLPAPSYQKYVTGIYTLENFRLRDNSGIEIYRLPEGERPTVMVDTTGIVIIKLPKLPTVSENEKQALFDLRAALAETDSYIARQWQAAGNTISMWDYIKIENERVVGIGYSKLDNFLNQGEKKAKKAARTARSGKKKTWTLPASFKNLTALKYFTLDSEESLTEIPAFLKDMTTLEELELRTADETIPELPNSLKLLIVNAPNLTSIPLHISSLKKLIVAAFNIDIDDSDDDYPLENHSRIASIKVDFSNINTLKTLFIYAGPTCLIPFSIWKCTPLHSLVLIGFINIPVPSDVNLPNLKELSLFHANITPPIVECVKKLKLEHLSIVAPEFGKDGFPHWIGQMSSLIHLSLDSCGIESIPASLDGLVNLEYLGLYDNARLKGQLPPKLLRKYQNNDLEVDAFDSPDFSPDGITLRVSPEYIKVPGAGDTYQIEIQSNSKWTIQIDDFNNFIHTPVSSRHGNATIKVTVDTNISEWGSSPRHGSIRINAGTHHSCSIEIEQQQLNEDFRLSISSFKIPSQGGTRTFDIEANCNWNITTNVDWIQLNQTSGYKNQTVGFSIESNVSEKPRQGQITIRTRNGNKYQTIDVTQENSPLPQDSVNIPKHSDRTKLIGGK